MALNSRFRFPKHQYLTCRYHTLLGSGICISLLCCMNGLANANASIKLMLQAVNPGSIREGRYDQPHRASFPAAGRVKYPGLRVFLLRRSPRMSYSAQVSTGSVCPSTAVLVARVPIGLFLPGLTQSHLLLCSTAGAVLEQRLADQIRADQSTGTLPGAQAGLLPAVFLQQYHPLSRRRASSLFTHCPCSTWGG